MKFKYCCMHFGYAETEYNDTLIIESEIEYESREEFLKDFVQFMKEQYVVFIDSFEPKSFYRFLRNCDFLGCEHDKFSFYDYDEKFKPCCVSDIVKEKFFEIKEQTEIFLIQAYYVISDFEIREKISEELENDGYHTFDYSQIHLPPTKEEEQRVNYFNKDKDGP